MSAYHNDALYRECIPTRPTPADPYRMEYGPTAQWAELERKRELWALANEPSLFDDTDEVGAA